MQESSAIPQDVEEKGKEASVIPQDVEVGSSPKNVEMVVTSHEYIDEYLFLGLNPESPRRNKPLKTEKRMNDNKIYNAAKGEDDGEGNEKMVNNELWTDIAYRFDRICLVVFVVTYSAILIKFFSLI